MKTRFFLYALTALLIAAMASPAFAQRRTRDLVFEDAEEDIPVAAQEAAIENAAVIAVKTTLELTRGGQTTTVLPTHEFKSGDRVKLCYTVNSDGYVYWLAKMSSGTYSVLFPTPQTGMDNFVRKNDEHTVPVKGSFRFDDTPGTESLLMVFAPDRVPELEQAVAEAAKGSGTVQQNAIEVAQVEEKNTSRRTTRDLVFEEEDEEDVNTRTQVAPKGDPFVAAYDLQHK